jgi:hypothetical protein
MYISIFIVVVTVTAVTLKKSLDKIEENTSILRDYARELLEKSRKFDIILEKLTN